MACWVHETADFIKPIGGAATAWRFAARAQHPNGIQHVGVLANSNDAEVKKLYAAFSQELERPGWSEGRNVHIDYRFMDHFDSESLRAAAAQLVASHPDVIVS